MNEFGLVFSAIIAQSLVKITCFYLGYLTVKLGYRLIISGAKGEFKFTATAKGIKGGLQSASPGLLFVLLGTILIGYAMYVQKEISFDADYSKNKSHPEIRIKDEQNKPGAVKDTIN